MEAPCSSSSETPDQSLPPLAPIQESLRLTQFGEWYPRFRKHAPKATVLNVSELEPSFLEWLESDSIFLPSSTDPVPNRNPDSDDDGDASSSSSSPTPPPPSFPNLDQAIQKVLTKYTSLFPKLNWSAPLDAAWILPSSRPLECFSANDIYLLLKSSDFIVSDLELLSSQTSSSSSSFPLQLILKQWYDFLPSNEFRCFVRNHQLIAISQRQTCTFYPHLEKDSFQQSIKSSLSLFFYQHVEKQFPFSDYIFDVYWTKNHQRWFLIDFHAFHHRTDLSLFSSLQQLESLVEEEKQLPILKIVTDKRLLQQSLPTYSCNMFPMEMVQLSHGSNLSQFTEEWFKQMSLSSSSSKEDEDQDEQEEKEKEPISSST